MERIKIKDLEPGAYKAMLTMESYLQTTSLTPVENHLIRIRASQINGCAFCLDMHTREARSAGVAAENIYLLSAWREAPQYSERERILLELTEQVTLIHSVGLSNDTYDRATKILGDKTVAQVIMAIIAINGWNRIAIATKMQPALG